MALGRRIGIVAVAIVLGSATTATTAALSAGPGQQVSIAYSAHHTFVSTALQRCVESTVHGTLIGTRTGTGPFVRWTGVHLQDPAVTAAGYELTAGRCDHARRSRLTADLRQTWSVRGTAADSIRSTEGPTTATLFQFNSGAAAHLPDRGFPASILGSSYGVDADVLVEARFGGDSEGFRYPVVVELDSDAR